MAFRIAWRSEDNLPGRAAATAFWSEPLALPRLRGQPATEAAVAAPDARFLGHAWRVPVLHLAVNRQGQSPIEARCRVSAVRESRLEGCSLDLRMVQAAAPAGYLAGTTCECAATTPEDDLLTLPRKAVSRGDDLVGVAWKLLGRNQPKRPQIRR